MDLFKGLSDDKIPVIEKVKGPCLVLAGAGTGKTKTIVTKIAYLVNKGVSEDKILCLTFSNNAASSLKEKISELLGKETISTVSTFHGFCNDILKEYGNQISIPQGFNLISDVDTMMILFKNNIEARQAKFYSNSILKAKDLNISIKKYEELIKNLTIELESISPKMSEWEEEFKTKTIELRTLNLQDLNRKEKSLRKNELNLFLNSYSEIMQIKEFVTQWKYYENYKENNGMLDFADLNLKVLELLELVDDDFLRKKYDYVIIDEFQDTSYVQFELIKKVVNPNFDITVVGDANQTIYAFRGAFTDNIEYFKKEFKLNEKDEFKLVENFRSTKDILDTSYELIKHNYEDETEVFKLNSNVKESTKVKIIECVNGEEEARRIVEMIDEQSKNVPLSDICVLYRSHSQGAMIKKFLEKRGYPLQIYGGTDIFSNTIINNVISFLEILANFEKPYFKAGQAWWRILHNEGFLSSCDSVILAEYVKRSKKSVQQVIYNELNKVKISPQGLNTINQLKTSIEKLRKNRNGFVSQLILKAYEIIGLVNEFKLKDDLNSKQALMNLKDFYTIARDFEKNHSKDVVDFVEYLRIIDELGTNLKTSNVESENSINLMTIHASKGLEFPIVFIVNMVKGRFPLKQGGIEPLIPAKLHPQFKHLFEDETIKDISKKIKEVKRELKIKEERKLAYVAMTRAKKELNLTYALQYNGGKTEKKPSEFINEIINSCELIKDEKITDKFLTNDSELDRYMTFLKKDFFKNIDESSYEQLQQKLLVYKSLKDKKLLNQLNKEVRKEIENILNLTIKNIEKKPEFNPEKLKLSYSSLSTYNVCPKKFELNKVLNMPKIWEEKSSHAMLRGSFVHKILEEAVKRKIETKKELYLIKEEIKKIPEFKEVKNKGIDEALEVFWIRNTSGFKNNLFTEEWFDFNYKEFKFVGVIDRVDKIKENEIHIIDYKTGRAPDNEKMFLQFAMYSFAIKHDKKFEKYVTKKLSLQLLEDIKDKTYEIKEGILIPESNRGTKPELEELETKIINLAKGIKNDFSQGFKRLGTGRDCEYCEFKFYCK
jgi:ATP-dependent DNA helicase UvrD/PcrA